jgi:uncharacterized protein (DUF111 family)
MFLGALLDLGLARRELEADLAGLGVEHALRVRRVKRGALAARHLEVRVPHVKGRRSRKSSHHHGRSYAQIRALLEKARLEDSVRTRALAIFEALGHAEAKVHGCPVSDVHFHEVGAVDAIVDVTGAAIGLHRLGIERVTCTPLALGYGTGAAIARVVVDEFQQLPAMQIEAVGYGAGEDTLSAFGGGEDGQAPMPNVLRAVVGRAQGSRADRIVSLESNLDDLVPEHFDYLMERLFEEGALDVSLQHLQMKKNRPGFLVRVLARPVDREILAGILFAESTAIGVRVGEWDRIVLEREQRRVDTPYGRIAVKLIRHPDGHLDVSAEYDACRRAARRSRTALREVVRCAEALAREELT